MSVAYIRGVDDKISDQGNARLTLYMSKHMYL